MKKILIFFILFITVLFETFAQYNVLTDQADAVSIEPNSFEIKKASTATFNLGLGAQSLGNLNMTSSDNYAFGYRSLNLLQSGTGNIAIGSVSLQGLENNSENVAVGAAALALNKGSGNTAIGYLANAFGPTSNYKLSIGSLAAAYDSSNSIVVGGQAGLFAANAGRANYILGAYAAERILNSDDNVAVGAKSMRYGNSAKDNVAIGYNTIQMSNGSVFRNVAIGYEALKIDSTSLASNLNSRGNVVIGYMAMLNDTNSLSSVAIGYRALNASRNVDNSVAMGYDAFRFLREGEGNVGIGYQVGGLNTISFGSTTIEFGLSEADNCTLVGYKSGQALFTEGYRLTGLGSRSLSSSFSNTYNLVGIGANSGDDSNDGVNNTFIGAETSMSISGSFNTTVIGYRAVGTSSSMVALGNDQVTAIGGYANFTNFSDRRLKRDIKYNSELGLDFIRKLKPATYNYKSQDDFHSKDGFIAQDVEQLLNELGLSFSGHLTLEDETKTQQLSYEAFTLPLINSTIELNKKIEQNSTDWTAKDLSTYFAKLQ